MVVGGGIGGFATAISLAAAGMTVTVLERPESLSDAGAGIAVWPNGIVRRSVLVLRYPGFRSLFGLTASALAGPGATIRMPGRGARRRRRELSVQPFAAPIRRHCRRIRVSAGWSGSIGRRPDGSGSAASSSHSGADASTVFRSCAPSMR